MKKTKIKLGFIGCGNMGQALVTALIKKKIFKGSEIGATTLHPEKKRLLRKKYKIQLFDTNAELAQSAPLILLAVKPQQMKEVLQEIAAVITPRHLVITIAAGLDTLFYLRFLPKGTRLIRAMPNTPSLLGMGATGLFSAPSAKKSDRQLALKIFSAVGKALFIPQEEWLDIVTALSGAGPAFVYHFIDSMIKGATQLGLPEEIARPLFLETVKGAVEMIRSVKEPIDVLISRVASKGGTTEAGLNLMREKGFAEILRQTVEAATNRAKELRGQT
ncbi:MAG: pyrroline-5-carboxylate reductase [Deltaproteobacteria bacterium]|nr:pyrroline-5-carboxylate reductase [Deltaproteobacteria bacterium]